MKLEWKYFFPAVLFGVYLLISRGVPLLPVLAGCVAVAGVNMWLRQRHAG